MTATRTKKEKQQKSKKEELIPLQCYACKLYDGTFGLETEAHTHVCESCKELPTDTGIIERHAAEYFENENNYGEETLGCERCGLERDECRCTDNVVRTDNLNRIQETIAEPQTTQPPPNLPQPVVTGRQTIAWYPQNTQFTNNAMPPLQPEDFRRFTDIHWTYTPERQRNRH